MDKKLTIFLITVIVISSISALVYKYRCKIFKCEVIKPNEPVPSDSPTSDWVPEKVPYNVGMYGDKIRELQKVLKIEADGKLGTLTKNAILNKGYNVPLSQLEYDKLISTNSNNPDIGKQAKANKMFTILYWANSNSSATFRNTDEVVGQVTGITGDYYLIMGGYKVRKVDVYLV